MIVNLREIAEFADQAIGNAANREGDSYHQGVRDLAAALAGLSPRADVLGIGTLADALEGYGLEVSP